MIVKKPKLIILGIDGASWNFINEKISLGQLAYFKKLEVECSHSILESTIPPNTSPAGPVFYTGKNPGKLGILGFRNTRGEIANLWNVPSKTLWEYLNEAGFRTLVVNVPVTHPPKKLDGVMISDFPTNFEHGEGVYPQEIVKKIGHFHPTYSEWRSIIELANKDTEAAVKTLTQMTFREYEIFSKLMKDEDFDFGIFWAANADIVNHFSWHRQDLMTNFYEGMGEIVKKIKEEFPIYDLIIISDHGGEAGPTKKIFLNSWLYKNGFLSLKGGLVGSILYFLLNILKISMPSWVYNIKKKLFNKKVKLEKGEDIDSGELKNKPLEFGSEIPILGVDLEKSKVIFDSLSGIGFRINPNLTDTDREKTLKNLISKLNDFKVDGVDAFEKVFRREEIFNGPYLKEFPEIIFLANKQFTPNGSLAGGISKKLPKTLRSGSHVRDREGIFFASGESFKNLGQLPNKKIADIMPTVLHYFGLKIPRDIDGLVIEEIFNNQCQIGYSELPNNNKEGDFLESISREFNL